MQRLHIPHRLHFSVSSKALAWLGIAAIVGILSTVGALTVINYRQTSDRLETLSRDTAVGDAYGRMLTNIAEAAGHSQAYQATGDTQELALTLQSIQATFAAEAEIKALGDEEDIALMTSLEQRYGAQVAQAQLAA